MPLYVLPRCRITFRIFLEQIFPGADCIVFCVSVPIHRPGIKVKILKNMDCNLVSLHSSGREFTPCGYSIVIVYISISDGPGIKTCIKLKIDCASGGIQHSTYV